MKASLTSTQINLEEGKYSSSLDFLVLNSHSLFKYYKINMLNHIIELNPLTWIGDKLFDYSPLLSNLSQYFSSLFL